PGGTQQIRFWLHQKAASGKLRGSLKRVPPMEKVSLPAAAAVASAAATAAATSAVRPGTSFIDAQIAAAENGTVERGDSSIRVVVIHLDETESAGTAGLTIADQADRFDSAVLLEQLADLILGRAERQIADVEFLGHPSSPFCTHLQRMA